VSLVASKATWRVDAGRRRFVERMRDIALSALPRMYLPGERMFGWCIRRRRRGDLLEGVSRRYSAIVLIGVAAQEGDAAAEIFHAGSAGPGIDRLLSDVGSVDNLGDVALTLWAAVLLDHDDADRAAERLYAMSPATAPCPTVELAWAVTALTALAARRGDSGALHDVADRLIRSYRRPAGLFPHWPAGAAAPTRRAHVSCFADWVYPVQALAHYHRTTGDPHALETAVECATHMVALQGRAGQWWWHYDVRTGRVVEGYPVYAVHQDSMAPMALFDLTEAGGPDFSAAVNLGLDWLAKSPERGDSLVDEKAGLIWRKVCRREPGKLTRGLQAAATRVHPAVRLPLTDVAFPPTAVDYECRPYHLGWILYAFSDARMREVGEQDR